MTEDIDEPVEEQPEPATKAAPAEWGVMLYVRVAGGTPEDAVEEFLQRTLRYGLRQFTYSVRQLNTGDMFVVENGEALPEDEYLERRRNRPMEEGTSDERAE